MRYYLDAEERCTECGGFGWVEHPAWLEFHKDKRYSGMEEDPYDSVALEEFRHAVNTAQNIIMSRVFSKLSIKLRGDE